jgi:hypothetical protein
VVAVFQVRWVEKRALRQLAGAGNGAGPDLRARRKLGGDMLEEGVAIVRAKWSGGAEDGGELVVG